MWYHFVAIILKFSFVPFLFYIPSLVTLQLQDRENIQEKISFEFRNLHLNRVSARQVFCRIRSIRLYLPISFHSNRDINREKE